MSEAEEAEEIKNNSGVQRDLFWRKSFHLCGSNFRRHTVRSKDRGKPVIVLALYSLRP